MNRTKIWLLAIMFLGAGSVSAGQNPFPRETPPVMPLVVPGVCDPPGNVEEVSFDVQSIPLEEWLKNSREVREVPWAVSVGAPRLQYDQRTAVQYSAILRFGDLKPRGVDRQLAFVVGVNADDGRALVDPAVHAIDIAGGSSADEEIAFSGCLYFRPGRYTVWLAVYDAVAGKHSLVRRNVHVTELKNDPLPNLESLSPVARFPELSDEETTLVSRVLPESLALPVANKRPLHVDLISLSSGLISPRFDTIGLLSQLDVQDGLISVTHLDLEKQKVLYSTDDAGRFDYLEWLRTLEDFRQNRSIDIRVLQADRNSAAYLRAFLERRIGSSTGYFRVVILLSDALFFPRGSDLSGIHVDSNCDCRFIRLQFSRDVGSDDVSKVLKPAKPQRFEVASPLDLRKAVARIVRELEEID